ncbi:MAG: hypothetical protein RI897_819 [Verrucomicrobiota bacterium]|jgi:hypothetical protein
MEAGVVGGRLVVGGMDVDGEVGGGAGGFVVGGEAGGERWRMCVLFDGLGCSVSLQ